RRRPPASPGTGDDPRGPRDDPPRDQQTRRRATGRGHDDRPVDRTVHRGRGARRPGPRDGPRALRRPRDGAARRGAAHRRHHDPVHGAGARRDRAQRVLPQRGHVGVGPPRPGCARRARRHVRDRGRAVGPGGRHRPGRGERRRVLPLGVPPPGLVGHRHRHRDPRHLGALRLRRVRVGRRPDDARPRPGLGWRSGPDHPQEVMRARRRRPAGERRESRGPRGGTVSVPVSSDRYHDVIVIGTGAGGGTFAHRLAPSGTRVLMLERGGYLPRERANWDSTEVFVKGRYRAPEFWYDRHGREFPPEVNYYVGGNTKFYGAALFRLRPADFTEIRHHGGISPAWPLSYSDLEPYYCEAEHLYQVHGRHGEDPTAGPASRDYPHPPVQHEPRIQQLSDDLEKQGLHPFHLPIGVHLTQDAQGMATHDSVCIRCDRVDGFPCLVNGKADAQVVCVDPALAHPNVELRTGARVTRLETDPSGRTVTAVVAELGGDTVRFGADVVVVACGAVNSAALLLRSANDRHPHGLANGSGVVGRHYMRHNNLAVMAVSKEPNPTRFQKTLALNDWYSASADWVYPIDRKSVV